MKDPGGLVTLTIEVGPDQFRCDELSADEMGVWLARLLDRSSAQIQMGFPVTIRRFYRRPTGETA